MRRLITVQDTFQVTGRGLVVVPGPLRDDVAGTGSLAVELRKPTGERVQARLALVHTHQSPPAPPEIAKRWTSILRGVVKADVPIGTEVWELDELESAKLLAEDRALFMRAWEESSGDGASNVRCDVCGSPIAFRKQGTVTFHSCDCGKFTGTLKGL